MATKKATAEAEAAPPPPPAAPLSPLQPPPLPSAALPTGLPRGGAGGEGATEKQEENRLTWFDPADASKVALARQALQGAPPPPPPGCAPLARAHEARALDAALAERLRAGRGGLVWVTGRSGTGKSLTVAAVLAAERARWRTAAPGFEGVLVARIEEEAARRRRRSASDAAASDAAAAQVEAEEAEEAEAEAKAEGTTAAAARSSSRAAADAATKEKKKRKRAPATAATAAPAAPLPPSTAAPSSAASLAAAIAAFEAPVPESLASASGFHLPPSPAAVWLNCMALRSPGEAVARLADGLEEAARLCGLADSKKSSGWRSSSKSSSSCREEPPAASSSSYLMPGGVVRADALPPGKTTALFPSRDDDDDDCCDLEGLSSAADKAFERARAAAAVLSAPLGSGRGARGGV